MEDAGEAERTGDSEGARDGVKSAGDVVVVVLATVENVKASAPEHDRSGDDQHARIEGSANRDPGGGGSDAHGEAEKQVRPAGETLGVGVGADDDQRQRREMKGERIQHPGGEEEQRRSCDGEAENELAGEQSGGQGADGGARIQRVDIGIHQAVEGHGGRARRDHGNTDPAEGAQRWNPVGGDDRAGESEGEREEGMLPLDHLKSYARVMKNAMKHVIKPFIGMDDPARSYCIRWPETYAPWRMRRHLKKKEMETAPMKKRQLGHSGIEVPTLCLGGNVFGWTADEPRSFELLDALLESGLNFVDTADVYSHWAPGNHGGESETIIGKWFKARGNRSQVILATKVGLPMGEGKQGLSRKLHPAGGGGFVAAAADRLHRSVPVASRRREHAAGRRRWAFMPS